MATYNTRQTIKMANERENSRTNSFIINNKK